MAVMSQHAMHRFPALFVILFALSGFSALASAAEALTLEERLSCHRAIERIYWENRIWPDANPGERPAFAQAVPESVIHRKAQDSLLQSAALAELWRRPLSTRELQAELERIAENTRRPEVLERIFAALGHDPERAAECLARPLIANRKLRSWYARDERLHGDLKSRAEAELATLSDAAGMRWLGGGYSEHEITREAGGGLSPVADQRGRPVDATRRWSEALEFLTRALDAPGVAGWTDTEARFAALPEGRVGPLREDAGRFYAVAVLEKGPGRIRAALVEWPKRSFEDWWEEIRVTLAPDLDVSGRGYLLPELPSGGCTEDSWSPTRAPVVDETQQTAVWTGSEMIVWGGAAEGLANSNEGGRYDPVANRWAAVSTTGAPTPRKYQSAVWTGDEMLVWGGCADVSCNTFSNAGGRYDPLADSWESMSTGNAPDGRYGQQAVWTGSRMLVWGGWTGTTVEATGGVYDPAADSWSDMDEGSAPTARFFPSAVWTGTRMIVWGGREGEFSTVWFDTGGIYDPTSDTWSATTTAGAPSQRDGHAAVWTGDEMLIFGGYDGANEINTGGRYDPDMDSWSPMATLNAPIGRTIPASVWSGSELVVWGGISATGAGLADGARYSPVTDTWVPVGIPETPTERTSHSAIWSGTELIVWGGCGIFAECPTDTGATYDVITDSWNPTPTAGAPSRREFQNTHWTGTEMILWGGCADAFCFVRLDDGGRYNPVTRVWTPLSTVGTPRKRYWHDGVWTGTEMIVWGGCHNKDCTDTNPPLPRDGGRYNPSTDTWTPTNEADAPGGRWFTSTTWTGSEMIVWGGEDMDVGRLNDGSRYDPVTDTWSPMTTAGAPSPRTRHRSHWTGDRLVVWGGNDLGTVFNTGGLYDPATDTWSATSTGGAPSPRAYPYTAWTGRELLVWGGFCGNTAGCDLDDGAFYDPVTEDWRPITMAEAPLGRADLWGPAWTGSEMIVFGGTFPVNLMELRSGGVYCAGEVLPTAIFGDDFETGDLGAWSSSV